METHNTREVEQYWDEVHDCYMLTKEDMEMYTTQQLQKAREDAQAEYKQFVLNVLDGVDIADGQCNTKAIRFALESRIIHSELDQDKV